MRAMHRLFGALAATLCVVAQASATIIVPEGTSIAGEPASLLGYDATLNDYVSGAAPVLTDSDIEFLTDDFALGIDFRSDGVLRLWDNLGTGADLFNYTLRFSFLDLADPLQSIWLQDTTNVLGGNLFVSIIDSSTFELQLRDVQFSPGFAYADVGISVDEPATLPLLALGLLAAVAWRRRSVAGAAS
jgi:MYXO-CTERM domain-containing protein